MTRHRWDDPDLPVFGKSGREIAPEKMVIKAKLAMETYLEPEWRDDPTYNLRRKKNV